MKLKLVLHPPMLDHVWWLATLGFLPPEPHSERVWDEMIRRGCKGSDMRVIGRLGTRLTRLMDRRGRLRLSTVKKIGMHAAQAVELASMKTRLETREIKLLLIVGEAFLKCVPEKDYSSVGCMWDTARALADRHEQFKALIEGVLPARLKN